MTQLTGLTEPLLTRSVPSIGLSRRRKEQLLSTLLDCPLDRVGVLGDEKSGHTGCVNALSWAKNGELLISGGDDTTVRLWRLDSSDMTRDYPFVCETIIHTGHHDNIFNAHMLPNSNRIATVAADKQVRISDVGANGLSSRYRGQAEYSSRHANVRTLRCHNGRVKRIVTEESPDLFLTVSEDGSVRQHDLRVPHNCHAGACPAPLVRLNHELSTLALSPLTPYQFVVAGESPYGYLFDRRHAGRSFQEEWGMLPDSNNVTTCVRRFGRPSRGVGERRGYEHITGAKVASSNGHEVLLSYSSDAVYLYSTRDEPQTSDTSKERSSVLAPNRRSPPQNPSLLPSGTNSETNPPTMSAADLQMEEDIERLLSEDTLMADAAESHLTGPDDECDDGDDDAEEAEEAEALEAPLSVKAPIIYPRLRFAGACNVETVKDVNFLGPHDDFVVSGSDDGNLFMWRKSTGRLYDILEGDSSVVNVIEGHPHLPLIAVSGIDTTIKLFGPMRGPSAFSRFGNVESIVQRNSEAAARRIDLSSLFIHYQIARRAAVNHTQDGPVPQCAFQ